MTDPASIAAKPLKWRKPTDHPCEAETSICVADGIGGKYSIQADRIGKFLLWFAWDAFVWAAYPTLQAAKDAAEIDWQKRFRAHLERTAK
jgi:hypothetical protein